ncbi:hypothetical protein GQX74_008953 [Glossina fuscipes]|nr:hypothetical protein GQX74_008953 [Glossina fuscipes]
MKMKNYCPSIELPSSPVLGGDFSSKTSKLLSLSLDSNSFKAPGALELSRLLPVLNLNPAFEAISGSIDINTLPAQDTRCRYTLQSLYDHFGDDNDDVFLLRQD